MSWWSSASTEQRLTQVDAGIELGMTSRQVALASGTTAHAIRLMASYHSRRFAAAPKAVASKKRRAILHRDRDQFIRGNAVDFWSHEATSTADEIAEVSF